MGRIIGKLGRFCLYSDRCIEGNCLPVEDKVSPTEPYGAFNFNYGPSAGGLLEAVQMYINTYGEYIRGVRIDPYYKFRQVKVLGKDPKDALPFIERINASFSASHTIAFLFAIEKASEIHVDYDILKIRILELEMERIRNHLFVIGRLAESAGFQVPTFQLQYITEKVNRKIGKIFGHRYFFGINSLCKVNFMENSVDLSDVEKEFKEIYNGLLGNRGFIDRLQGTGVIKDERSIGPAARAGGFHYDARVEVDNLPYKDLNIKVITQDSGDAFSRMIVRGEEVFESIKMISEIKFRSTDNEVRIKDGEGIGRVESPSGDLAYYVKLDSGKIMDVALFSPSVSNIEFFSKSIAKNIFTDLPFNWESFGIWISEVGVKLV